MSVRYERMALTKYMQSLVGFIGEPPYSRGNYFSVLPTAELASAQARSDAPGGYWLPIAGHSMNVLNMWAENFDALPSLGVTGELDVIIFQDEGEAPCNSVSVYISDERIPAAYRIHDKDGNPTLFHGYRRRSEQAIEEIKIITGLEFQ